MEQDVLQRVRLLAKELNLSDNALAKKLGIPQATLSGWYNLGRTPSIKMALTLLEVFPNLSAEWLLRGEGEMFKTQNAASTNGNNGNAVTGNNISNVSQVQKKGFSARLVAALIRGCDTKEEENKLIDELDALLDSK